MRQNRWLLFSNDFYNNKNSFLFNGTSQYFTSDANAQSRINSLVSATNGKFSLSFWVKPTVLGSVNTIMFGNSALASRNIEVYFYDSAGSKKLLIQVVGSLGTTYMYKSTTTNFTANNWYKIDFTYDGTLSAASRGKIYVNATLDGASWTVGGAFTQIQSVSTNYLVGALYPIANYFKGNIASFSVISRVLSQGEITSLYNGRKLKDPRTVPGVGFYAPAGKSFFSTNYSWTNLVGNNYFTSTNMTGVELTTTIP